MPAVSKLWVRPHPGISEDKLKRGLRPFALGRLSVLGCAQGMDQSMGLGLRHGQAAGQAAPEDKPKHRLQPPALGRLSVSGCAQGMDPNTTHGPLP